MKGRNGSGEVFFRGEAVLVHGNVCNQICVHMYACVKGKDRSSLQNGTSTDHSYGMYIMSSAEIPVAKWLGDRYLHI